VFCSTSWSFVEEISRTEFNIIFTSDLDDTLGQVRADDSGDFSYTVNKLSEGQHRVIATTMDPEGIEATCQREINILR